MVDAYEKDKNIINNAEIVSDTLKALTVEELEKHVQEAARQRAAINIQINELQQKRIIYKIENSKGLEGTSLQENVIKSVKKQAKKKGYKNNNGSN